MEMRTYNSNAPIKEDEVNKQTDCFNHLDENGKVFVCKF